MEINLEAILDIAQIALLIAVIVQIKSFRDIWWSENVAGAQLRTQAQNELIDQFGGVNEDFKSLNRRLDRRQKTD